MTDTTKQNPERMLPLSPAVLHILLTLAGGERHGYSIMQGITKRIEGAFSIGPTTLYRSIKKMLEQGMIIEVEERPDPALDDERRRYYCLTTFGRSVLQAEIERMEHVIKQAHELPSFGQVALGPKTLRDEYGKEEIKELIVKALLNDESHHKQWYLWKIAEVLGLNLDDQWDEEYPEPEKGIAP